jgi:hypothetical protein
MSPVQGSDVAPHDGEPLPNGGVGAASALAAAAVQASKAAVAERTRVGMYTLAAVEAHLRKLEVCSDVDP